MIDLNAAAVLESDTFVEIDQALLCDLFARDQLVLCNGEIAIWNAVSSFEVSPLNLRFVSLELDFLSCQKIMENF